MIISDLPREVLVQLVRERGPGLVTDVLACSGLLRDKCGTHRREIFALISAAKEQQLARELLLETSLLPEQLVQRIAERLFERTGIDRALAQWAIESWALALGILKPDLLGFSFRCPGCREPGRAPNHWQNCRAICPRCNTTVRFTESGSTEITGQTQSRTSNRIKHWRLLDDDTESLRDERLRDGIEQVLDNPALTDHQKAQRLLLRKSLARLEDIALDELDVCRRERNSNVSIAGVVQGMLEAYRHEPGVVVGQPSRTPRLQSYIERLSLEKDEVILGLLEFASYSELPCGVIFTSLAVHYFNPPSSQIPSQGTVRYDVFPSCDFTKQGLQVVSFGSDGHAIDLSGAGISTRLLLLILNSIKETTAAAQLQSTQKSPLT